MKKILIVLAFVLMILGLRAQTGLLGLYYGESFSVARTTLQSKGFMMIRNWPVAKEFALEFPTTYYLVTLYINPDTSRMVGWSISYKENLGEEVYQEIFGEVIDLHGGDWSTNEETRMISCVLDETKVCVLSFDENQELRKVIYFDEKYTSIFDREGEKP